MPLISLARVRGTTFVRELAFRLYDISIVSRSRLKVRTSGDISYECALKSGLSKRFLRTVLVLQQGLIPKVHCGAVGRV